MKTFASIAILLLLAMSPLTVLAQEEEETQPTYIYATYFYCDVTKQEAVDKLFEEQFAPAYKSAQADGVISGWGWMAHHTGGKWRRLQYHMAHSVEDVINAQAAVGKKLDDAKVDPGNEFGAACNAHDDYIWQSGGGNVSDQRGTIGLSVYMVCDMTKEERADELVESFFTPIYNDHLGEGKLASWGWLKHIVGGKYRRLVTMSAANIGDLMKARASILEAGGGSDEAKEFTSICGSHSDYIWDLKMEGR